MQRDIPSGMCAIRVPPPILLKYGFNKQRNVKPFTPIALMLSVFCAFSLIQLRPTGVAKFPRGPIRSCRFRRCRGTRASWRCSIKVNISRALSALTTLYASRPSTLRHLIDLMRLLMTLRSIFACAYALGICSLSKITRNCMIAQGSLIGLSQKSDAIYCGFGCLSQMIANCRHASKNATAISLRGTAAVFCAKGQS